MAEPAMARFLLFRLDSPLTLGIRLKIGRVSDGSPGDDPGRRPRGTAASLDQGPGKAGGPRSEEHTSELQSPLHLLFPLFFLKDPPPPKISPLPPHASLPIYVGERLGGGGGGERLHPLTKDRAKPAV